MKCIVTRSFQHRGGMWRTGQPIDLSADELLDAFVKAHVRPAAEGERPSAPSFAVGKPKTVRIDAPGKAARAPFDPEAATKSDIMEKLDEMGARYPRNASRSELAMTYAKAAEALAGSPDEANRPKTANA